MERVRSFHKVEEGEALEETDSLIVKDNCCKDHHPFAHKCDGRLFPQLPLYSEGFQKTCARGYLHFFSLFILPWGFYHFYIESNGHFYGRLSGFLYVLSNILCYGCSALYHVFKWAPQTEILLQKLDHCGIAILSWGTMLPVSFLLLDHPYGFMLAGSCGVACIYTCYNILNGRPSVVRQAIVPGLLLPYLPMLYYQMTSLEFTCTILCIVFQSIGLTVFVNEKPDPIPNYCGFHEVFHFFVFCAGVCVYLANWSLINRLCNDNTGEV